MRLLLIELNSCDVELLWTAVTAAKKPDLNQDCLDLWRQLGRAVGHPGAW